MGEGEQWRPESAVSSPPPWRSLSGPRYLSPPNWPPCTPPGLLITHVAPGTVLLTPTILAVGTPFVKLLKASQPPSESQTPQLRHRASPLSLGASPHHQVPLSFPHAPSPTPASKHSESLLSLWKEHSPGHLSPPLCTLVSISVYSKSRRTHPPVGLALCPWENWPLPD